MKFPNEQVEFALDIHKVSHLSLELSAALATDLAEKGYHKHDEGEWIFHKDGSATCNQCKVTQKNIWDVDNYQNYCGHCGARMIGGQ